jgi:putative endopeptidase
MDCQIVENYTCKDFCKFQNNGETTLAENISDILAMQCCLEILKTKENPNYQAFFESFAKVHRFTGVESFITYRFSQDIHSMPRTRVNKTVANFQEFYDTYNIKKNHAMYINPNKRIKF